MNPGRPTPPPKPKRNFPRSRDLRDSGISVSEDNYKASVPSPPVPPPKPTLERSAGGVRQLASRFESIRDRSNAPTLAHSTASEQKWKTSGHQLANVTAGQGGSEKSTNKPVIPPKPLQLCRRTIHPQEIEQRANAIAEQIYDTVCIERKCSKTDVKLLESEPLYEDPDGLASTDGYSSFESSDSEEEENGSYEVFSFPGSSVVNDSQVEDRPSSLESHDSDTHIARIIAELLDKERRYIETLEQGIQNYVPAMYSQTLPAALRGMRTIIFINLEEILRTHRDSLLPDLERATGYGKLVSEGQEVEQIARTFLKYIEEERLYCYVEYALHHAESEAIRAHHHHYFLKVQHDLNDQLGLNSLLLQPIQRLPRYKLLMNELVKDLLKDGDGKRTLNHRTALLCKVEKRLGQLIDRVNQAINIRDIRQCNGSASAGSLTHHSDAPLTLILNPKGNRLPERDTPINLLYQGKFLRLFLLDIYDVNVRRKYSGKLFAFEKLLIYAEVVRDRLEYRGHYTNTEVSYTEEGTNRMVLFAGSHGRQEIIVQSETNAEMRLLLALLQHMTKAVLYDTVREEASEAAGIDYCTKKALDYEDEQDESAPYEDIDDCSEIWDEQKLTTALIAAQERFIEVLQANQSFYLDTLSGEVKNKLTSFIKAFEVIQNLHTEILMDISKPPTTPSNICQYFERYLMSEVFAPYIHYLREFRRAVKYIQHNQTPSNFHNRVASTAEQFTFLCIEHLQEFNRYFETLIVKYSDDSTLNLPIDKELFQRLAFVQVRLNAYRVDLVLNYDLFLLDDRLPACGLVFYNDRATLSQPAGNDLGPCRMFVCERAAICIKLHDLPDHGKTVERFVHVIFLDGFEGRGTLMKARRSNRRPQRVNFLINGTKYSIDFRDQTSQKKFFRAYVDKYTRM